ncbi:MAG: hypothetical protein ACE5E7_13635 [Anaerolineae bacterium]
MSQGHIIPRPPLGMHCLPVNWTAELRLQVQIRVEQVNRADVAIPYVQG